MDQPSHRADLSRRAVLRGVMAAGVASGIVPAVAARSEREKAARFNRGLKRHRHCRSGLHT